MRRFFISIVLISALLVFGTWIFAEMPGSNATALWMYITKEAPYKDWSFWPDHQDMQPGRAPHGPWHKVYVNDILLRSEKIPVQYGSIQVKENYSTERELKAITVMYKIKGFNPEDGDWFWVQYTPDGKTEKEGKVDGCIGCHGTRARNDFIIVHDLE